jgi:hypothetical protein
MSFYSGRALYKGTTTNHGRGLYSPATGRMLYAGPSWLSGTRIGMARRDIQFADTWNQTAYNQDQLDSMAQLRATSWTWLGYPVIPTESISSCWTHYGYQTLSYDVQACHYFTMPAGARGNIRRVLFQATAGSGRGWDCSPGTGSTGIGGAFRNTAFDDFGQTVKLYFYNTNTPVVEPPYGWLRPPSPATLLDSTPPWGLEIPFSTINAYHTARGATLSGTDGAALTFPAWTLPDIGGTNMVDFLNGLSADTFYLFSAITRPSLHPYLFDPAPNAVNDFCCHCTFDAPKVMLVT